MELNDIVTVFPELLHYLELIPVLVVSILAGVVSYYNRDSGDIPETKSQAFKNIGTSAFLGVVTYSILSAVDLQYLAKIGISSCVAFFGIDKSIELVQKLLSLRSGGGKTDDQKNKDIKDSLESIKKADKKSSAEKEAEQN